MKGNDKMPPKPKYDYDVPTLCALIALNPHKDRLLKILDLCENSEHPIVTISLVKKELGFPGDMTEKLLIILTSMQLLSGCLRWSGDGVPNIDLRFISS